MLYVTNITPVSELSKKDSICLELSINTINRYGEFPDSKCVGSVLNIKNKIHVTGRNKTIPKKNNIYSLHAEMDVLNNCKNIKNISNTTLYVARLINVGKNNESFGCSKPCSKCQSVLKNIKFINKVKYTDFIDGKNVLVTATF